jgi:hypothetical protein
MDIAVWCDVYPVFATPEMAKLLTSAVPGIDYSEKRLFKNKIKA